MAYNQEERSFRRRDWFQFGLFVFFIITCLVYHYYLVMKDTDEEKTLPYLGLCLKIVGATFSAYLTHYATFTTVIYRRAMKKWQNFEF